MASSQHIAVLRGTSMDRIKAATEKLAHRFEGVEAPDLDRVSGRNNPELKFAQQLDLLAGVLEQVLGSTSLMQASNDNRVNELETRLEASAKSLRENQEGADSIIKDHQAYIQKLEEQLAEAQTQLLDLTGQLETVKADKADKSQGKGGNK
ncbi:MAG: hypothetical protein J0I20_35745 [Chloroflexi bacterium]|nr:hypothetical protein [Chloroflexota bacterium]OJV86958.1 MAG: hypothetical protein BGO39_28560 [Chloroflexi bacterium 54-19]